MTKTILVSGTTLIVGFLVGVATGALLAKKQPREKEYAEMVRELPDPTTIRLGMKSEGGLGTSPLKPPVAWQPAPGELCDMATDPVIEFKVGDVWVPTSVLPTDAAAFARHAKYARAGDRVGMLSLLFERRAVWTDVKLLKGVLFISKGVDPSTAEVRVGKKAYLASKGGLPVWEYGCEAEGTEVVVPLLWLTKKE